jgi:hypothetical protein
MKHFSHNFFIKICWTNPNWPFLITDYNSDTPQPIHSILGFEWIDVESFALFDHGHNKCQILVRQKNSDLSLLKFESSVLDIWYIILIWTNCMISNFKKRPLRSSTCLNILFLLTTVYIFISLSTIQKCFSFFTAAVKQ